MPFLGTGKLHTCLAKKNKIIAPKDMYGPQVDERKPRMRS